MPSRDAEAAPELVIGSLSSEHLLIRPLRRNLPNVSDYWDGNWLTCEVGVRAGAFKGRVEAQLRTEELAHFLDALRQLQDRLDGNATFKTLEDWVRVALVGDGQGHIAARCEVRDRAGNGNRLIFELNLDQTFLPRVIAGLEEVVRAYPVIGKQ